MGNFQIRKNKITFLLTLRQKICKMKGFIFTTLIAMVFLSLSHGQDLPECIYDAFPELNKTEHSTSDFAKLEYPKGFTCDLCVNLLTEIENIMEDQTIDDAIAHAVENLCLPIIWAFEPCYKIVEACLPDLIEAFVNELVPPREFCELLFICPETMRF